MGKPYAAGVLDVCAGVFAASSNSVYLVESTPNSEQLTTLVLSRANLYLARSCVSSTAGSLCELRCKEDSKIFRSRK
jgi:hypothetical protein